MHHIADETEHIYLALGATDFRKQQKIFSTINASQIIIPNRGFLK